MVNKSEQEQPVRYRIIDGKRYRVRTGDEFVAQVREAEDQAQALYGDKSLMSSPSLDRPGRRRKIGKPISSIGYNGGREIATNN